MISKRKLDFLNTENGRKKSKQNQSLRTNIKTEIELMDGGIIQDSDIFKENPLALEDYDVYVNEMNQMQSISYEDLEKEVLGRSMRNQNVRGESSFKGKDLSEGKQNVKNTVGVIINKQRTAIKYVQMALLKLQGVTDDLLDLLHMDVFEQIDENNKRSSLDSIEINSSLENEVHMTETINIDAVDNVNKIISENSSSTSPCTYDLKVNKLDNVLQEEGCSEKENCNLTPEPEFLLPIVPESKNISISKKLINHCGSSKSSEHFNDETKKNMLFIPSEFSPFVQPLLRGECHSLFREKKMKNQLLRELQIYLDTNNLICSKNSLRNRKEYSELVGQLCCRYVNFSWTEETTRQNQKVFPYQSMTSALSSRRRQKKYYTAKMKPHSGTKSDLQQSQEQMDGDRSERDSEDVLDSVELRRLTTDSTSFDPSDVTDITNTKETLGKSNVTTSSNSDKFASSNLPEENNSNNYSDRDNISNTRLITLTSDPNSGMFIKSENYSTEEFPPCEEFSIDLPSCSKETPLRLIPSSFSKYVKRLLMGEQFSEVETKKFRTRLIREIEEHLDSNNLICSGDSVRNRKDYSRLADQLLKEYSCFSWNDDTSIKSHPCQMLISLLSSRRRQKRYHHSKNKFSIAPRRALKELENLTNGNNSSFDVVTLLKASYFLRKGPLTNLPNYLLTKEAIFCETNLRLGISSEVCLERLKSLVNKYQNAVGNHSATVQDIEQHLCNPRSNSEAFILLNSKPASDQNIRKPGPCIMYSETDSSCQIYSTTENKFLRLSGQFSLLECLLVGFGIYFIMDKEYPVCFRQFLGLVEITLNFNKNPFPLARRSDKLKHLLSIIE